MIMKKYDFDTIVPRRGTGSYKWDTPQGDDVLPMWVADMDFRTAPEIIDALMRRVAHGVFGYTLVPERYYEAVIGWFKRRHGLVVSREHILYTSGVVPAVSAIIKGLTAPGDGVIVQTPVYNCFFSSIRNNGCRIVENPLVEQDGAYVMDFDDLERKAADPRSKIMLLCNPHNPGGRVWTREELTRVGRICIDNGVTVVSDEIHCELVFPGHKYTPFASVSAEFYDKSITCSSPSKAFNTAGLQIANIFVADEMFKARIDKAININEVCDVNPFGVEGLIAAYNHGEEWLSQLMDYLHGNYMYLRNFFNDNLHDFPVMRLDGTYLAWVDCRVLKMPSDEIERHLVEYSRVMPASGATYRGDGFIRINFACPRQVLAEGLRRIADGLLSCKL